MLERNEEANKARLVAGYCWDWKGKKNPEVRDVVIPEHDFAMRWNLDKDGPLWLRMENSVREIGCIHTCQGLELDYVGVIIGPDFVIRDGLAHTDATKRRHRIGRFMGTSECSRRIRITPSRLRIGSSRIRIVR